MKYQQDNTHNSFFAKCFVLVSSVSTSLLCMGMFVYVLYGHVLCLKCTALSYRGSDLAIINGLMLN